MTPKSIDPFAYPLRQYPIALLDYFWVITIYAFSSFYLALLIDGYLLPPYDQEKAEKENTLKLTIQVVVQIGLQGFIAILLCALLQKIPSPLQSVLGYNMHTTLGVLIRNPTIISVILITLSKTLRGRALVLFDRMESYVRSNASKKPTSRPSENPPATAN